MIWPFSRPKLTIAVVCTANVCRSPAAEALLKHHLAELGVLKHIAVRSLGTDVGSPGRKPDPRVLAVLQEMGVSARGLRAQAVTMSALKAIDLLYVMEFEHRDKIIERFPEAACRISLLDPDSQNVPDPYYGSKADVRLMVEQLRELTRQRARLLMQELQSVNQPRAKS